MKNYKKVHFKGTFRHYQQNVLDQAKSYLDDKKIHIVAAPGSGKTTLGIELIKRINAPALILSPSLTIRNQWGDRFDKGFLDDGEHVGDYVSYTLKEPKLITSVTYQGLHAAYNKIMDTEENDDELIELKSSIDFADFDLIQTIQSNNITTICLDEAHHLRNEWHYALTEFLEKCGTNVTIISLTATPPYDSSPAEWRKYIDLCGPIDDEIFVPELVARKNLCPHQDYIYFNYPSKSEKETLKEYKIRASEITKTILKSKEFNAIIKEFLKHYLDPKYNIFEDIEYYITLVNVANSLRYHIPPKLKKIVKERKFLHKFDISHYEDLLKYIINHNDRFDPEHVAYIKKTLTDAKLIEKGSVNLEENDMLKKALVSSIGKLRSIAEIATFESQTMKSDLRMLILTDFIKSSMISIIGSSEENTVMGAVPIFEEVRRSVSNDIKIAILTGSLVICPNSIIDKLDLEATNFHTSYSSKELPSVPYQIINFKSSNRDKVKIMTKLFEAGEIHIMIGTKALLGEGWDSPSINTLILASFVGSFMLSNQMRGRAIRVDKKVPHKVASIWHLATIEPTFVNTDPVPKKVRKNMEDDDDKDTIKSHDYDTLSRRFQSFLGPIYSSKGIESGIERIDIIKPPYNEKGFAKINHKMLQYAANRDKVRKKWDTSIIKKRKHEILDVTEVPPVVWPLEIFIFDFLKFVIISAIFGVFAYYFLDNLLESQTGTIIAGVLGLIYLIFFIITFPKVINNLNPKRSVHSLGKVLLKTLKDMSKITSKKAQVITKKSITTRHIKCSIINASRRDKVVFSQAITEMMTQIDNPKYIIVKKRKIFKKTYYNYWASYSVPKDICTRKEYVDSLAQNLRFTKGNYSVIYTRSVEGRDELIKCKRKSRLSRHIVSAKSNRVLENVK